jgi:hypothetical protein
MPGVSISTAVRTGPVNAGLAPASTFFIVGETERGTDSTAVAVASLSDYEAFFGGYEANKYTYQQMRTFFEEGGSLAYVARASDLNDGVAATAVIQANPTNAAGITLTAVGVGTWGNSLYARVINNDDADFDIAIYYGGNTSAHLLVELTSNATLNAAVEAINNNPILARYCTAALTTGATGTALLEDHAVAAFTLGDDGTIAEADFIAALDLFGEELGAGAVAIPGLADGTDDDTLYDAIKTHCEENGRIGLISLANGTNVATAASDSVVYGSGGNAGHEYLALYYPWVTIPSGSGTTLTIPPEAYVAAARSRAHNRVGSWQPFAGVNSESRFVNGVATGMSRTQAQTLDDSRVNAIRIINGTVRIYGARSHSLNTTQWRFITHRDTMNFIVEECQVALEPLVFSVINGRRTIYADIATVLKGVLEPIRIAGGLFEGFDQYGRQVDYGYTVRVDDGINPIAQLESGLVKAQIGVRISSIGDKIEVTVTKSNLTATLV